MRKPFDGAKEAYEDGQTAIAHATIAARKEQAARAMLAALQDAAGMLPVAARLHPKDLATLQTDIVSAIAAAKAAGIGN